MTNASLPAARAGRLLCTVLVAALALAAAAPGLAQTAAAAAAAECGACGKVESIRVATANQQWTPLGTGVGVGGVPSLGDTPAGITSYKIGPGLSNQGMVVLGSAGGAASKKTPNSFEQRRWEVTVRMDAGGMRILSLSYEPYVQEGDHVRVSGNSLELAD